MSGDLEFHQAVFHGEDGVDGMSAPLTLALSPDGRHVYVAGSVGNADEVAMFSRDVASGTVAYLGKVAGAGFRNGLDGAIAVSPDGERVLVAGTDLAPCCNRDGVSIFRRDPATGLLGYVETLLRVPAAYGEGDLGYPTSIAFAPDGRDVYVAAAADSALNAYRVLPRCSAEPRDGCRTPTRPRRSQILLTHGARDGVLWKWRSGEATSADDFGDTRATTDYAFCVHREVAGAWQSVLQLVLPAASTCANGAPCWRGAGEPAGSAGYTLRDAGALHDGVTELRLTPGADGRASILLRGRGPDLDLPPLPLGPAERVVAQLRTGEGACWGAEYAAPALRDDVKRFADQE